MDVHEYLSHPDLCKYCQFSLSTHIGVQVCTRAIGSTLLFRSEISTVVANWMPQWSRTAGFSMMELIHVALDPTPRIFRGY